MLETPKGNFSVSIPTLERPALAVGDMVQVRGVCSVWLDTATLKIGGFFLYAPTLAEVQVMAGGAASPGVLTEIKQVRNLRADEAEKRPGGAVARRRYVRPCRPTDLLSQRQYR